MKKVFLAVLAIAAMMVSCQKEGLVDNQKETPEVEVNEPQPVILGSNLFKAPTTKASVDDMTSWKTDGKDIYVYAINNNTADNAEKVLVDNVAASLKEEEYTENQMTGSLDLKDPNDKPFYYGTDNADIYDFYAYYLGYDLGEGEHDYYDVNTGVITVPDVEITGVNDIMFATTDRVADAINNEGQMVNPTLLYSQYSARHGVTPNLVFKHQLSKFTFFVQYAGVSACDIDLMNITFQNVSKFGKIILSKAEEKFEANEENKGPIILGNDIEEEDAQPLKTGLPKKNGTEDNYGDSVGYLMVAPAAEYNIAINFVQKFDDQDEPKAFDNTETLNPGKVVDNNGNRLTGDDLLSFKAGNNYNVYITVYGLEEVKVDVTLTEWDEAGKIIIDRDAETDGIMKQVTATFGDDARECTLYAAKFEANVDDNLLYCKFTGESDPEAGKLVFAPVGTYTVTGTEGELVEGTTITVEEEGKIANVVEPEQETPGVE